MMVFAVCIAALGGLMIGFSVGCIISAKACCDLVRDAEGASKITVHR